jgi:hypothetical protein
MTADSRHLVEVEAAKGIPSLRPMFRAVHCPVVICGVLHLWRRRITI